ncbi:hypothetical protein AB0425_16950 [Actinosynnema sp. NPDC051121]
MKETTLFDSGTPPLTSDETAPLVTVAAIRAQTDAGVRRQRRSCHEHAQKLGLTINHDTVSTRSLTDASVVVELKVHRVDGTPKEHRSILGAAIYQSKQKEIMQLSARIATLALDVAP